ncbi:DUF5565 family protein [Fluviicola sp.]|uniref:RNA ligase 1 family protein n=1 Tax=Fluviicola sp. TaxID=1917219 RepID=UPI0031E1EB98
MKKISTLFKKDPNNLGRVINEINPENSWVLNGEGIATRKFDGTSVAIIGGVLHKRYDVKKGRTVPENAIPCQEADSLSGHHPHWLRCERAKKEDQFFFEAFDALPEIVDGTYELCGPKIQGNPEKLDRHVLIPHGKEIMEITDFGFEAFRTLLSDKNTYIEGIVFHHIADGRMCKIRKKDFGIKR